MGADLFIQTAHISIIFTYDKKKCTVALHPTPHKAQKFIKGHRFATWMFFDMASLKYLTIQEQWEVINKNKEQIVERAANEIGIRIPVSNAA
jgi:hypothetical protein